TGQPRNPSAKIFLAMSQSNLHSRSLLAAFGAISRSANSRMCLRIAICSGVKSKSIFKSPELCRRRNQGLVLLGVDLGLRLRAALGLVDLRLLQAAGIVYIYCFPFRELIDGADARFSVPVAGLLDAAERQLNLCADCRSVDVNDA